jgi:hypothetical protein
MVDGRKEGAQWARDIILTVIFLPALLSWLGMTAPQIIIISICALALLKAWEHGRLGTTIVAIAIVGAGIGWDWFYYSTMTAAPQVTSPAQPSTAPQSPIGKIKPTPWVTQQEIDDQQKFGKILLTYSPKELLELWGRGG